MTTACRKEGESDKICILTATSGDTGKAALEGFAGVPGTEIIVFYPKDGVSQVQERQMVSQEGVNTHVFAIEGNFDDAQTGVKKIFADEDFGTQLKAKGHKAFLRQLDKHRKTGTASSLLRLQLRQTRRVGRSGGGTADERGGSDGQFRKYSCRLYGRGNGA